MAAVVDNNPASYALSPEQRAVLAYWSGEERAGDAVHCVHIELDDEIPLERLRGAVTGVIEHHEILRSAIRRVSGYRGWRVQTIDAAPPVAWHVLDDADELARFGCTPLDIEQGELVRVAHVRLATGRQMLALAVSALAVDRGSLVVLCEYMARICSGVQTRAPDLQYAQFVEWRRELETGEEAVAGQNYWRRYLHDAETWTAPRLVYRSYEHATAQRVRTAHRVHVSVMACVERVAASLGTQPEIFLQTVWWVLLAKLTGFNRYTAGWQHDCRRDYDVLQDAVGGFEKVLPLVIEGSGEEAFSSWLARLSACADAHIESQEYCPIDTLTRSTHLAVGFAYHQASSSICSRSWRIVELPGPMPCFELALQIDASSEVTQIALHADRSLYPERAIEGLLAQYVTLLEHTLDQPMLPVSELLCISASEQQALHVRWTGPSVDFGDLSLTQRIARWAKVAPDALAVVAGKDRVSYDALDARANRLAHWLRSQGVAPGALVALDLPRSAYLISAVLAVWRVGAGYVPLDPAWPEARKHMVLADACPALILRDVASGSTGPWREVVTNEIDLNCFASTPPAYDAQPHDLAYVLYTSGSTGRPKGVVIEQQQLLNYVAAASAAMALADCKRWGLVSSVAADLGNTALFGALFNGACLIVADENDAKDAAAFTRFIAEHDLDALKIVPSHLEALMEGETPRLPRTLVLGGEAAPRALIERIAQQAPECAVYNHYGPTETTVGVMVHRMERGVSVPDVLPLSCVLANNYVRVLDEALRTVPTGGLGELYVGGAQVFRGYLNREARDALVIDPSNTEQRLYRTGDLAWVLPDGEVRLAGRSDHQVKISGYRVELAEVEAALLNLPDVRQAVVMTRRSAATSELVAFVVGMASEAALSHGWRERLARVLPEYMLLSRLIAMEDFPRLPNGKVDRLALHALLEEKGAARSGQRPRDLLEASLVKYMTDLLRRESIGVDDDFFMNGGNSLAAIKLVARIRTELHADLPLAAVFDSPTAAGLAVRLREHLGAATDRPARRAPWVHGVQAGIATDRLPAFCFPGRFASHSVYSALWSSLAGERQLHGFVCHMLSEDRWSMRSMEELASGYVDYIAAAVGNRPIALLGWSAGGDVAFEVARQLAGRVEVRFLGLLDVCVPTCINPTTDVSRHFENTSDATWRAWVARSTMAERWERLLERLDAHERALAMEFVRRKCGEMPLDGEDVESQEFRLWAVINYSAMVRRYRWVEKCDVPMYVWIAQRTFDLASERLRDWSLHARICHSSIVRGCDHHSLLQDETLRRELCDSLRAADRSSSSGR